jgi:hypothetical protein
MRRAAKVDNNQSKLVAFARKLGFSVALTHQLGKGFPDAVLGIFGLSFLAEIKDGDKSPSQRKLTPDEEDFHNAWRGHICILECEDDVLSLRSYAMELAAKFKETFKRVESAHADGSMDGHMTARPRGKK